MSDPSGGRPEEPDIPADWDVLVEEPSEDPEPSDTGRPAGPERNPPVPTLNLMAGSWADVVTTLAVCTAALVGLNLAGHRGILAALPWAAAMASAWWVFSAVVLVAVRQGTPGMLLAGVALADRVAPRRLAAVVAAAALQALLLGLPAALGPRRSPVAVAAGDRIESLSTG
jgi:hypothetical protein